jgi:hypothetical protein
MKKILPYITSIICCFALCACISNKGTSTTVVNNRNSIPNQIAMGSMIYTSECSLLPDGFGKFKAKASVYELNGKQILNDLVVKKIMLKNADRTHVAHWYEFITPDAQSGLKTTAIWSDYVDLGLPGSMYEVIIDFSDFYNFSLQISPGNIVVPGPG